MWYLLLPLFYYIKDVEMNKIQLNFYAHLSLQGWTKVDLQLWEWEAQSLFLYYYSLIIVLFSIWTTVNLLLYVFRIHLRINLRRGIVELKGMHVLLLLIYAVKTHFKELSNSYFTGCHNLLPCLLCWLFYCIWFLKHCDFKTFKTFCYMDRNAQLWKSILGQIQ